MSWLSKLQHKQKGAIWLYEQGTLIRRMIWHWVCCLGCIGLMWSSAVSATAVPDAIQSNSDWASATTNVMCTADPRGLFGVSCKLETWYSIVLTTDADGVGYGLPFFAMLPDSNPSAAVYGARFYSYTNSFANYATSIPPIVSCDSAINSTPVQQTYSTYVELADGDSCRLTSKPQNNGSPYVRTIYTGTLARVGDIYTLTDGVMCGATFTCLTITSPSSATAVNADSFTITGTSVLNALVKIYSDANNNGTIDGTDAEVGRQQLSGDATEFSISIPLTQDADNNFIVITESVDTGREISDVPTITEDSIAPLAPSTPDMTTGTDSGISDSDNITNNQMPIFTGTAEVNATIELFRADSTSLGSTVVDSSGNWTVTALSIPEGNHDITAKATDAAGNVSAASTALSITIDTTAPTVTIEQNSAQADPVNVSPIIFDVVFSETVTGFSTGDVSLGGTAGATTGTVSGSDASYTVNVTGMSNTGTVTASLAADVATDTAGNGNTASTATDNQVSYNVAGFTVTETSGTAVNESGSTDSFTVVLNSQPMSEVVISVSSANTNEATVSASPALPLTFSTSNWHIAQTVTVTGVDDPIHDGDQLTAVTISVEDASSDDAYDGLVDQTVSVTTIDDDIPGFTVNPVSFTISEPDNTADFIISLDLQPTGGADVTVPLTASADCTLSTDLLTISNAAWNTGAMVTVTAVDDDIINTTSRTCTVTTGDPTSADSDYEVLGASDVADISVTVTDDDSAGINIVGSLNIIEGRSNTYDITLSSKPTGDVQITVTADEPAQTQVSSDGVSFGDSVDLTFSSSDWNTPQTITVQAVGNNAIDGSRTTTISHAVTGSVIDSDYPNSLSLNDVTVNIRDDDTLPTPIYYSLSLNTDGTGSGEITGHTSGSYISGSRIELSAEPADNSVFVAWQPESCGEVFNLFNNTICTATFDLVTFNLTVLTAGSGSGQVNIKPEGDGGLDSNTLYLLPLPDEGSSFDHWEPESCGQVFQLIADTTCTAWFETIVEPTPPAPENTPPQLLKALPDLVMVLGDELVAIALDDYFSDDGALNYQVVSSPQIDVALIDANQLNFNTSLLQVGTLSFTVRATDAGNLFVEDTFLLTIGSPEPETEPESEPQTEPEVEPELPEPETPETITPIQATNTCPVKADIYYNTCNAGGQMISINHLMPQAVIADGIIEQVIENEGWLINIQITANGQIKGGKLSGTIDNQGLIEDIEFKGKLLQGGTLGGYIRNTSPIGGVIKDVQFALGSVLEGGRLGGNISGDPVNPVRLQGATVTNGSHLSHVIIDRNSKLPDDVTFGAGVRFASDFPCRINGWSLQNDTAANACFKILNGVMRITTAPEHRGQAAEVIFAAVDVVEQAYSYDGNFWQAIPTDIAEILNAQTVDTLPLTLEIVLPDLDDFIKVFMGYRLVDGEIVYYQVK